MNTSEFNLTQLSWFDKCNLMSEPQRYILIKRFYGFRSYAGLTSTSLDIIARYAVRTCKGGCQYKNSKISGQTCDGLAHIFVKIIAFIYVVKIW